MAEPAARLDTIDKGGHGRSFEFTGFQQLRQTASHDMNILNATKLEFDVLVEILIFITFASGSVGHRVYLKENG